MRIEPAHTKVCLKALQCSVECGEKENERGSRERKNEKTKGEVGEEKKKDDAAARNMHQSK